MSLALLGSPLAVLSENTYSEPPSSNLGFEIWYDPLAAPGITLTATGLGPKSVSVSSMVTFRVLDPPARRSVAPQKSAVP